MDVILVLVLFILCLFVMETFRYAYSSIRNPESKTVRKRLKKLPAADYQMLSADILRRRQYSDIPWFNSMLSKLSTIKKLDRLLLQANVDMKIGFFILLSLLLTLTGYFLASVLMNSGLLLSFFTAAFLGYLPVLYLRVKKSQRMKKFERQLPDLLELIARSLRAGQAFSGGMSVVAEEFDDPAGTEFERTVDEINFGVSVPDALKNLAARVDCPDLKFFVVSVIIQRESGGNLAEIIDSIAHVVRERFKLQGKIRALSAEGRFSAVILCALPFLMAFIIYLLNKDYMLVLMTDPIGKFMIGAALIMMVLGIFFMRRMIQIKV